MTTSSALASSEIAWAYPDRAHPAFVLRAGREEIGWLRFEKDIGAQSTAELEGHRWTLEHNGLHHPRVTIRDQASNRAVAEFTPCLTGGGVARFPNGRLFCWTREHIWSGTWCFRCKENKSTVCVSQETRPLTAGSRVTVCSDAAQLEEAPVLVLLAWYLRVLEFEMLTESVVVCG